MPSVENFYWVLYNNLLKPTGIDCWYYYPWGTTENLSRGEFHPYYRHAHANHVLFHFDQEPLWTEDLGFSYERVSYIAWSNRFCKILANSEHSMIKKQVLRARYMQDWYFFYHGFAALDWYRDSQYINSNYEIQDAFLCLNHIVHGPRAYRLDLISRLVELGINNKGKISLHSTEACILSELNNPHNKLDNIAKKRIKQYLVGDAKLPWTIDNLPVNGDLSARFGHQEYQLWQSSFLHLVTETVFYDSKLHLTEKIFKPIVSQRPFILVGAPHNLSYLRSYGFITFDRWIDESYDEIEDPNLRLSAISTEIKKISALSKCQLQAMLNQMSWVLEHNKQHFFNEFRRIIVDELLQNFQSCISIWNNGRVDNREVVAHPDIESVRKILLS